MQLKIIGLVGFIGSGKGTIGNYLIDQYGYKSMSFASTLKDAVSSIFGWERHLLEGDTAESREWRELPDQFWSKKLDKVVTPRWVLQYIGTDVLRNHFHTNIWIDSLEKKLLDATTPIVITDVRFPNEVKLISNLNGKLWWIRRNPEPEWLNVALFDKALMPEKYPTVHSSEYAWLGIEPYTKLYNNTTLHNLYLDIDKCLI